GRHRLSHSPVELAHARQSSGWHERTGSGGPGGVSYGTEGRRGGQQELSYTRQFLIRKYPAGPGSFCKSISRCRSYELAAQSQQLRLGNFSLITRRNEFCVGILQAYLGSSQFNEGCDAALKSFQRNEHVFAGE